MPKTAGIVLAIDAGASKTGVAIGNTLTRTSTPLEIVRGDRPCQLARLLELCKLWHPQTVVFGLPEKERAKRAHKFASDLAADFGKCCNAGIEFVDEAYSTQAARTDERAKSLASNDVDAVAACLLAEDYLDQAGS